MTYHSLNFNPSLIEGSLESPQNSEATEKVDMYFKRYKNYLTMQYGPITRDVSMAITAYLRGYLTGFKDNTIVDGIDPFGTKDLMSVTYRNSVAILTEHKSCAIRGVVSAYNEGLNHGRKDRIAIGIGKAERYFHSRRYLTK